MDRFRKKKRKLDSGDIAAVAFICLALLGAIMLIFSRLQELGGTP